MNFNEYNKTLKQIEETLNKIKENPKDISLQWRLFHLENKLEKLETYGGQYAR